MSSNSTQDGAAFAADLRAIRENRGVTLDEIHDQSKIPLDLLEGFERDALFSHGSYNLVYLRSLMRTYVEPLDLDEEVALGALEAAWEGHYNRELAVAYSGVEAPAPRPAAAPPTPQPEPQKPTRRNAPATKASAAAASPRAKAGDPAARKPDTTKSAPPVRRTAAAPSPRARAYEKESTRPPWLLGALGVLGLALVGWAIFALVSGGGDEAVAEAPRDVAVVDTTTAPTPDAQPTRPPAVLATPMQVVVSAKPTSNGLQETRVTVDDEIRRPYWVEPGESMPFTPSNRIVIENDLDDATITLDGYAFPTTQRDAQGRIVIDRASGQAHLDIVSVQ